MAARPRVPGPDALHARRGRRDGRARRALGRHAPAGRGRLGGAGRPARHVRQPPSRGARRRSRRPARAGFGVRRAEEAAAAQGYWRILRGVVRGAARCRRRAATRRGVRLARGRGVRRPRRTRRAAADRQCPGGVPRGAARPGRADPARGAAPAVPRARPDRVRPRGRGRAGHARLRDPGGDHVPRRRARPRSATSCPSCFAATRPRPAPRSGSSPASASPSRMPPAAGRSPTPRPCGRPAKEALDRASAAFPEGWGDAKETADFDVIEAALDRVQAAAAAGEWGVAEQARLEAYGVFELGPEQRLRGLAPGLFRSIEGLFWYGDGGSDGLVQLVKRKAAANEIAATRAALDDKLGEAETRIGAGPRLAHRRRREQLDHRLPRGARSGADPRRADGEHGRRPAPPPPAAARRGPRRPRRERDHVGGGADGARVARRVGRAARGRRLARRDRRAAPDPQLVLPPCLLAGEPPRPPPQEEAGARGRERRDPLRAGARPRRARLLERVPRRLRDGALPPGPDPRGRVR